MLTFLLFMEEDAMMTENEKAKWLQKHYGNYSISWYLSDISRLNAIFTKEYKRYIEQYQAMQKQEQQKKLDSLFERMRVAYKKVYKTDYDIDCANNRLETNQRVQAIRNLWLNDNVA